MCLTKIIKQVKKPDPRVRIGYKVFETSVIDRTEAARFPYQQLASSFRAPRGKWLTREAYSGLSTETGTHYPAGFHVFKTKQSAETFKQEKWEIWNGFVQEVLFKGARVLGEQDGHECFVADKIFIPKKGQRIVKKR